MPPHQSRMERPRGRGRSSLGSCRGRAPSRSDRRTVTLAPQELRPRLPRLVRVTLLPRSIFPHLFTRNHRSFHEKLVLASEEHLRVIKSTVECNSSKCSLFYSRLAPSHIFEANLPLRRVPLHVLSDKIVLFVSVIGCPDAFIHTVKELGSRVCANPHGLSRKYRPMCCCQCFHSNAMDIGFIKFY